MRRRKTSAGTTRRTGCSRGNIASRSWCRRGYEKLLQRKLPAAFRAARFAKAAKVVAAVGAGDFTRLGLSPAAIPRNLDPDRAGAQHKHASWQYRRQKPPEILISLRNYQAQNK